ncbi:GntR family transcriptional regulator [Christensenella tenuis]|uniref:GntR family transcriptional regulator n=1 Tax=Christensenella tenuis TaxID=2763033 RepID=A0ABR7EC91_9FIRM|nr:GntR family transcriptional regulator [Christensenella tenuis]MBC5646813.1 GntR family transcriptional regulator [Christensenella tenuis]
MKIDFESGIPIYLQIADQIEDAVLSGIFPEDTQVPSTTELSTLYKINPATVLKGVTLLAGNGVLYKRRGVGMFVCAGAKEKIQARRKQSFFENYVASLLSEAEKLGISPDEVISMIKEGAEND